MKLVKGQTLSELLAERPDPSADRPRLLNIASQVAQAMAYAHAKGVIHRDLKPGNIMVGAFGEVQVMDWGLAKVLTPGGDAQSSAAPSEGTMASVRRTVAGAQGTHAGSTLGTPAYMPPEQARGKVEQLDPRS